MALHAHLRGNEMIYLNAVCGVMIILMIVLASLERNDNVLCTLSIFSAVQLCLQSIFITMWHYNVPMTMRWAYGGWKRTYTIILRDAVLCTCLTINIITGTAAAVVSLTYSPAVVSFAILLLLSELLFCCLFSEVVNITTHKPNNGTFDINNSMDADDDELIYGQPPANHLAQTDVLVRTT